MIHIINKHNQHLYSETLDQMFKLRYEIFVEEKGWAKLQNDSKLDIDQFDTDEAVYFLKLDEQHKILGGMRLLPTSKPTQLGTIFKEWCHFKKPPTSPDVWEWSRYFIADNSFRSEAGYPVFYELFFSILEYAVAKKIIGLSGFLEAVTLPRLNALPWKVEYLGNIVDYGGTGGETAGKGAAVQVAVDKRMLRITKRMKKMVKPYFAVPLGENCSASHKPVSSNVCFQFLDFVEEHPQHVDVLLDFARIFSDQEPDKIGGLHEEKQSWLGAEHHKMVEDEFQQTIPPRAFPLN